MAIDSLSAFFSYCREDAGFAHRLAEDLKSVGVDVWVDRLAIAPGAAWDEAIQGALKTCSLVLVILSPASVESRNVRDEYSFALNNRKRTIPILYEDCEIPYRLDRLQQIDFRSASDSDSEYDRALKALLKTLTSVVQLEGTQGATERDRQPGPSTGKSSLKQMSGQAQRRHRHRKFNFYPVILAGGRGTRFWPLSRKRMAKQLLPLNSEKSMILETVSRLRPLADAGQFWVITNTDLCDAVVHQLKGLRKKQIIAEPVGRNTAPAIGLAAFLLVRCDPRAVIGMFPSDHVVADEERFRRDIRQAAEIASRGPNIVVVGIRPTRAETGYGYIEAGSAAAKGVQQVRRFTEKPSVEVAEHFFRAGNYFWNSGMFVWSARTLADALTEHLPNTAPLLDEIAASYGTRSFAKTFAKLYPECENISIDYAVLEPRSAKGEGRSGIYCIPASFGWNDLGSWAALYEHLTFGRDGRNIIRAPQSFTLNAEGNLIHSERKFVAAVGVKDLVVVETDDALLITTREHSQDVGKVVKHLDEKKLKRLV